ncbi:co-chaperone HscB [Cryptosporangium sp. NPDC048952]|uniref:co-chaperone HscB n=1 Tax=Cryptosporangium sp. NPDC048952 TaxID=3363961 RepID=UPI0037190D3F
MTASVAEFLLVAAEELRAGGWVFTGFNLPVLAARLARRLGYDGFTQVLEAGAALDRDTDELLTSTTDYFRTDQATAYLGTSADVLGTIVPRCRRVLLDAANVDILGRTNSSVIGDWERPKVRLPGGGGAPDAAFRARHLVLLHGGTRMDRIVAAVSPVTAAPNPDATVRLVTRWGTVTLGTTPHLDTLFPACDAFAEHLATLGVDTSSPTPPPERTPTELDHATAVLTEATAAGYSIAATETRPTQTRPTESGAAGRVAP